MRVRATARGPLCGVETGRTLAVSGHPHDEANGVYLVLGCTLELGLAGGVSGLSTVQALDARFELHPASEPYRMPPVTPRPRIDGQEHAVIVGPAEQVTRIDRYNRVLLQYLWDRQGRFDGASSIWVRVALPWQGDQMGVVMHARRGQEVLVGYANGDPDRPMVTAFLPNAANMPPWVLPANQALTGIVSRCLGEGMTTNHLALDDTENRQQA